MNCKEYQESMMQYLDGDLNDIESAQLKQHLKSCPECSREYEEVGHILKMLETDSIIEPPLDFEEKVMERVRTVQPQWLKISDRTMRFLYGFTSFLLILLLSMFTVYMFTEGVFKSVTESFGPLNSVSDFFTSVGNASMALWKIVSDLAKTIFMSALLVAKTYYYLIIMGLVILFAIQWTFFSLLKQNQEGHVK